LLYRWCFRTDAIKRDTGQVFDYNTMALFAYLVEVTYTHKHRELHMIKIK